MREIANVIMLGGLLYASWGDWKNKEVSVMLLVKMSAFAVLARIILGGDLVDVVWGVVIGLCFFLLSKITREQIGYGDSWLITILGIYLGGEVMACLLLAACFGAGLFSLIFCSVYQWNRKYTIPFFPFLTAAFVGVIWL